MSVSVSEEDIAHPDAVHLHKDVSAKAKGKERSRQSHPSHSLSPDSSSDALDKIEYPPANDDLEETRRVQENLRRWEVAERQRRKAARGSSLSTNSSSLIDDVARRASLLWSTRGSKHASIGGSHAALHSQETVDALPLQQLAISPAPSTTPSPTHSQSDITHINDPFANPPELLSPFSDSFRTDAISPPSIPPDTESRDNSTSSHKPTLSSQGVRHPPPLPMPLNLPPPRTPPRAMSPLPSSNSTQEQDHAQVKPVRWWHEWLCGCGEGPDRGGEFQAGRTNPFE